MRGAVCVYVCVCVCVCVCVQNPMPSIILILQPQTFKQVLMENVVEVKGVSTVATEPEAKGNNDNKHRKLCRVKLVPKLHGCHGRTWCLACVDLCGPASTREHNDLIEKILNAPQTKECTRCTLPPPFCHNTAAQCCRIHNSKQQVPHVCISTSHRQLTVISFLAVKASPCKNKE